MEIVINGRFLTQRITGVQRYSHELVRALDDILDVKPELTITVMCPQLAKPAPAWRNVKLRQVGRLRGHAWEQFELPWYSRGKMLFCPGNTAPVISLLGAQPVIVTVHDLSYKYFPGAYRLAFRLWYGFVVPLALYRANSVITVSQSERRAIIAHYPAAAPRLHAISNGGLPTALSAEVTRRTDVAGNYILYVGSFSRRKNFPRMLEVAFRLARERNFHFVFVGGTSKGLTTLARDVPKDISSYIILVDAVDDPHALMSYYRKGACFLFASLYESSGLPPVEAMACGCPVIVSDIPALKERCGDAAVYCDPHDVESIVNTVERVMDDAALRASLQILGYQRAANLTWERCAQETLRVLCKSTRRTH
jgi:glycosyltransferase involved in cell wall biosynthesis